MVELEFDAPHNGNFGFRPAMREIRGRFDVNRLPEPGNLRNRFPRGVPGQRLGMDAQGVYVRETLYDAENAAIRAEIEKTAKLEPEKVYLEVDTPTFTYWVREAMKSGKLKLVAGALPEKVSGEPKKIFHHVPKPSAIDRLAESFDRLSANIEKMLAKK